MKTSAKDLGLPEGYEYDGPYGVPHNLKVLFVAVLKERDGNGSKCQQEICRVWFTGLVPFQPPVFPDRAMIDRIDATWYAHDPAAAVTWAEKACDAYGSLPVHLDTWDRELGFFQGRWVDRATSEPVIAEEVA